MLRDLEEFNDVLFALPDDPDELKKILNSKDFEKELKVINQIKGIYTQYADIFELAENDIDNAINALEKELKTGIKF